MVAINDGILLEALIYDILRRHVKGHAAYLPIVELFLETTHQTAHGQLLDLITAPTGEVELDKYKMSRFAFARGATGRAAAAVHRRLGMMSSGARRHRGG